MRALRPGDPERLGGHTLLGRIGEGGQGTVYLGRGPHGDVAVKLLHAQLSDDAMARSRFARELDAVRRIAGFCTARVYAADVDGDRPYIVSEYVSGPSLRDLVAAEGPRTEGALMRLAVGTATALAAIHGAGVVHRDFKPANVLMAHDGPRVIDFGIARALDNAGMRTMTGQIVGTPAYMAPEQFSGSAVGPAADLFAWAHTLVFAATGRGAFGAGTLTSLIDAIRTAAPDLEGLPPELVPLLLSCLAKAPSARPSSQDALWTLLTLTTPTSSEHPRTPPPLPSRSPGTADRSGRPAPEHPRTPPILPNAPTSHPDPGLGQTARPDTDRDPPDRPNPPPNSPGDPPGVSPALPTAAGRPANPPAAFPALSAPQDTRRERLRPSNAPSTDRDEGRAPNDRDDARRPVGSGRPVGSVRRGRPPGPVSPMGTTQDLGEPRGFARRLDDPQGEPEPEASRPPLRRTWPLVLGLLLVTVVSLVDMASLSVLAGGPVAAIEQRWALVLATAYTSLAVITLFGVVAAWRGYRSGVWTVIAVRLVRAGTWVAALGQVPPHDLTLVLQTVSPALVVSLLLSGLYLGRDRSPRR
ncbi:hypothetical protein GCM10022221_78990 [Actinocorallia aurea]